MGWQFGPFQHVSLMHTWKTCRESYTKQLDFYFLANQVANAKTKQAIPLMNLPAETYQLAKDLVAPAQLRDDANIYDVIMQRMWEQLKPVRSALVTRYEFDN